MNTILMICPEGLDRNGPHIHLMKTLILDLIKNGFDLILVSRIRDKNYSSLSDESMPHKNIKYFDIKSKNIEKSKFIKRYLAEVSFHFKARKIWKNQKFDMVFLQSCPTVLYSALFLKNKKMLYSIQDMWPGSAISSGVLSNRILQHIFYRLQNIVYKKANAITVISDDMKDKLIALKVPESKIIVIPNWFDLNIRNISWDQNKFVKKYNLSKDVFYVQYAGTVGNVFDYESILYCAKKSIDIEDIVYLIIGSGSKLNDFKSDVENNMLKNILFLPLQSQELVPHVYSACSIQIIPLKKGVIGNSVPSKLPLVYASHKTAICSVDSSSSFYKMINENKIGVATDNEKYHDLFENILQLYQHKDLLELYSQNGLNYAKENFSRFENTKKYANVFRSLMKGDNYEDIGNRS